MDENELPDETECQHDDHENGICIDCGAEVDWIFRTFKDSEE